MSNQFVDPSSGDILKPTEVNGHLLIIRPIEKRTGIATAFGESDAIVCDVADLDANVIANRVLWFSGALIGSLTNNIGQLVLARMGQGQAKVGQSPPWILTAESSNPDSVARASQFLAANPGFAGFTEPTPEPTPATPAAAPAAAQAASGYA